MTDGGFLLTRLSLTGQGLEDAEVRLAEGLNVISGPSDTGKTFVFQCIDFMLGGSRPPKDIPEAEGYETLRLELRARGDGREFALARSIRGGECQLSSHGERDRILGAKHEGQNEDTVSSFLLALSGLSKRVVRKNAQGQKRTLSFRDIARLILVDEETVISERSPLLSGQVVTATAEKAVFRLVLSGVDDASVIGKEDPRISKTRQEGRADVLDQLMASTRDQIAGLGLDTDEGSIREEFERVNALFREASEALATEQGGVADLERRRHSAWARLREAESRATVMEELQRRFLLLQEQYASDLQRLEAISEAGVRLGQMKEERCPLCGALAEHHSREHQRPQAVPEQVAGACRAEAEKIRKLGTDLRETVAATAVEVQRLHGSSRSMKADLDAAGAELRDRLRPRVQAALQRLGERQGDRDKLGRALDLFGRLHELEHFIDGAARSSGQKTAREPWARVGAGQAEDLSQAIENLLRSWHFPGLGRVTYDQLAQDVVIAGRARASHGKGIRAIIRAAFNIALLVECRRRSMPHPGLVAIDSPLVVYREPDVEDGVLNPAVKDAFFRSLASAFEDSQVIVFENEDPPGDLDASANVIRFSGTVHGRWGFIPQAPFR